MMFLPLLIFSIVFSTQNYVSGQSLPAPLFYFPFNNTFLDYSGNGYTATLTGTTSGYGFVKDAVRGWVYQQPSSVQGAYGGLVTNAQIPVVYSASIWFYVFEFEENPDGSLSISQNPQYLFGNSFEGNVSTLSVLIYPNITGLYIFVSLNNIGQNASNEFMATFSKSNGWYHSVVTFDEDGNKCTYLNGQIVMQNEASTTNFTELWQSTGKSNITIGFDNSNSSLPNNLYGRIGPTMFFSSVLSPAQVQALYLSQLPPSSSSSSSSSSQNLGLLIGVPIGGAVFLVAAATGGYYYYKSRQSKSGKPVTRNTSSRERTSSNNSVKQTRSESLTHRLKKK